MKPSALVGLLPKQLSGDAVEDVATLHRALANILRGMDDNTPVFGAWTPVLTFDTPGNLSVAYTTQTGKYCQQRGLITAWFEIVTLTFTHTTAAGSLKITGLPFPSENVAGQQIYHGACSWQGITKANYTHVSAFVPQNDTIIRLRASGSGQAIATIAFGDTPTAGSVVLRGAVTYNT